MRDASNEDLASRQTLRGTIITLEATCQGIHASQSVCTLLPSWHRQGEIAHQASHRPRRWPLVDRGRNSAFACRLRGRSFDDSTMTTYCAVFRTRITLKASTHHPRHGLVRASIGAAYPLLIVRLVSDNAIVPGAIRVRSGHIIMFAASDLDRIAPAWSADSWLGRATSRSWDRSMAVDIVETLMKTIPKPVSDELLCSVYARI